MKRIVLVDDHVIIRNGLKELIEKLGPFEIIAQFDNGRELVDQVSSLVCDLIIMDITMPEMDGDEAMAVLNEINISIPVLILTLNQDDQKIIKLFRMGVRGYLQKNCTATAMRDAITEIFRCGYYHNEFLAMSLRAKETTVERKDPQREIIEQLSERERVFLKLVCHDKEYTYEQIASLMGVQPRTVDGYRESIFSKLAIKSKTGLVLLVLRHKLYEKL
jgi:two-component system invasion response regulator UvrY